MSTLIESGQDREKQQKKQQEQQQTAIVRSRLVAKLLGPVPDLREFLHNLVYTQAVVVVGTEAAAFIVEPGQEEGQVGLGNVAHIRPDGSDESVKQKALEAFGQLIGNCFRTGQDAAVVVQDDPNDLTYEAQYCLVTLLRHENNIVAATAVVTRCRDEARAKQRLEMMQLVAGYFDLWMLRRSSDSMRVMAQGHQDVLQYASAISTSDGFQNAANNVCNELATRTGATRVSIGWAKQRSDGECDIKLAGLSHTEQFDKKQELSVQLVKVMEECVDQQEIVQYDPTDEHATTQNVTREASALSRLEGGNRVVTLPMRRKGEIIGTLTLEFPPHVKPTDHETTGLAVATEMLGPILADRHANDRYLGHQGGHQRAGHVEDGRRPAVLAGQTVRDRRHDGPVGGVRRVRPVRRRRRDADVSRQGPVPLRQRREAQRQRALRSGPGAERDRQAGRRREKGRRADAVRHA